MKQSMRIILKRGNEFVVECDSMTAKRITETGQLTSIAYEGCTKNRPLYLDLNEVAAVLQERV